MQLFYAIDINENQAVLDKDESNHVVKVLRKQVGDSIFVTNGRGLLASGNIAIASANSCLIKVDKLEQKSAPKGICLAVALPKTKERVQFLIEKSVELGCTRIQPIITERSERAKINLDKLNKLAISAMKQSARVYSCEVMPLIRLEKFMEQQDYQNKFIAYCPTGMENSLYEQGLKLGNTCVLIGPEGDFTEKEIQMSLTKGFTQVSLGAYRLRTETAALSAIHAVSIKNSLAEPEKGIPMFNSKV